MSWGKFAIDTGAIKGQVTMVKRYNRPVFSLFQISKINCLIVRMIRVFSYHKTFHISTLCPPSPEA